MDITRSLPSTLGRVLCTVHILQYLVLHNESTLNLNDSSNNTETDKG